jgi:hypothetical protein
VEPAVAQNEDSDVPIEVTLDPAPAASDAFKRFEQTRNQADALPEIAALKEKANSALSGSEVRTASLTYNRALFRKMRELDPSNSAFIRTMEAAMLKRVEKEGESSAQPAGRKRR